MKHFIYLCVFLLVFVPAFAYYGDDYSVGYAVLHSANDVYGIYHWDEGTDFSKLPLQLRTLNKLELSSRWFGIAGEYNYLYQRDYSADKTETQQLQSYAFGTGMPDPDFFRIFGKYHVFNYTSEDYKQDNTALSVELAKRYRSFNMVTELKGRYFRRIKENEDRDITISDIASNAPYNPQQSIEFETYLSSAYDDKLGSIRDYGIAPEGSSPFLLMNHAAGGIFGKFSYIRSDAQSKDQITMKATLPVNASRWFGLDFDYDYQGVDDLHKLALGLRPTLFIAGPLKFTFLIDPQMQLGKNIGNQEKYALDSGAIIYLLAKNYSNIWAKLYAQNSWEPTNNVLKIENKDIRFSGGINIRF